MNVVRFKKIWNLIKNSFRAFSEDNIMKKSAALAYYTIFSLPGMLMVIITVIDTIYGQDAIDGALQEKISDLVGNQAAHQIQEIVKNAAISGHASLASIIGILVLIYGATKMFGEMQNSINMIWKLQPKPKKGWLRQIINRLISFSMVLILGFLLLVSFVLSGVITFLGGYLTQFIPDVTVLFVDLINIGVSFIITAFLFAIIFKVLPAIQIRWKDVSVGAIVTTVLFMVGKYLIGIYMGESDVGSTYGAAGSIIVILLWIYYSATLLYFGVVFTKEYARLFGKAVYPHQAVWTKEIELEENKSFQEVNKPKK